MKRSVPFLLFCTIAPGSPTGARGAEVPLGVDLARLHGWDIVVSEDATAGVVHAASELQSHLEKASGLRLPISRSSTRPDRHFFVGESPPMLSSEVGFKTASHGEEDLRIVIRDDLIAIAGGEPRGTLYGVYSFLEDYLGVRFLTADHTHVPPVGRWRVVGPVDRFFSPPLAMRWTYYGEINRNPAFAARMRVNTVTGDPRLGGKTGITNISHSFARLIPSRKFGKEHPDYYSLVGGKRLAEVENDSYGNEPCLTNPDVLRIVTEGVLAEIERRPQLKNVSVSQNDNDKYCRCEKCAAIDGPEGTPMGSLLAFVNSVADVVARKHPDLLVGTLSYWYSRKPPRTIVPRPNVQIQLCSIECCLLHPIADAGCPRNVQFCEDMRNWAKICKNVSIWNYNTNFTNYLLPCPNLRVLEPNVRFFVANRSTGIFMQAAGNAWSAELSDLRNYMICRLIWDPSQSGDRLMSEFLELHYGRAAVPIRQYIDLIHDAAAASGVHRNCFARSAKDYGIGPSVAPRALALFEEASTLVAGDEEIERRVEKASIPAYRLAIEAVWNETDPASVDASTLAKLRPPIARFLELCARYEVDRAAEHVAFSSVRERLEGLLETSP